MVTRDRGWSAAGVETAASVQAALALAAAGMPDEGAPEEIVVAGGGEIYVQSIGLADRMRLTLIDAAPDGDTRFPAFDRSLWREVAREDHPAADGRPAFAFVDFARA